MGMNRIYDDVAAVNFLHYNSKEKHFSA